ncbi:RICIN domain-containing protein [Microbispora siamensis]
MVKKLLAAGLTAAVACLSVAAPASAAATQGRQLRNAKTGMCLAVGKGEARAGKKVIQWTCNNLADQEWYVERQ